MTCTVVILTWNSGRTLQKALESVQGLGEIILIDGGSTDDTLSIAREFNAKVIPQSDDGQSGPVHDFSAVRNRGLAATTGPWILYLDSDEYLSPAALEDIRKISMTSDPAAYKVARRYVLDDGSLVTHATTYPNERIYFFHRDAITGWERAVHERVALKSGVPVRHLAGHTCAPLGSVDDFWLRNERYMKLELEHAPKGWGPWLKRFLRAIRSQITSTLRLLWIWLIPRSGTRLPLSHEFARWQYRWKLVGASLPR